jgi:hypothetical protein
MEKNSKPKVEKRKLDIKKLKEVLETPIKKEESEEFSVITDSESGEEPVKSLENVVSTKSIPVQEVREAEPVRTIKEDAEKEKKYGSSPSYDFRRDRSQQRDQSQQIDSSHVAQVDMVREPERFFDNHQPVRESRAIFAVDNQLLDRNDSDPRVIKYDPEIIKDDIEKDFKRKGKKTSEFYFKN